MTVINTILGTTALFFMVHLFAGIIGRDFWTYDTMEFLLGSDRTLEIWWAKWFLEVYILIHLILIIGSVILIKS